MGTDTHCPYCALQCGITLAASPGDPRQPLQLSGRDFDINRSALCRKGSSAATLLRHPERVTAPLRRQPGGGFAPIGWDEALDLVAGTARRLRAEYGADAVAVYGSGSLTNEKAYQLGKFARLALGTSRIDYNGRYCMSSAAAAGTRAFGLDRGLPFPVADLDRAGMILLLGSNPAETMPPFVRHLASAREHGGLVVVDPRRTPTAGLCDDGAGWHLQPAPSTDLQLLMGLAHVVLFESLADEHYLRTRTRGELSSTLAAWWPERTAAATGIPAAQIRRTARALAAAAAAAKAGGPPVYLLTGRGVEQHASGTDTATAAINLALLLGLPGTAAGGYGTLTGQGNGQGGREHGQKCDQLPGCRKIADPAARAHVARIWGVDPAQLPGPGLPAAELLRTLGTPGGSRMLMVHGSNPVHSSPDASAIRAALERLDFLVVSDFFLSATAQLADVVLPVPQWAEEEGTMTNLEGRILRRRAALAPPGQARSELWILAELASRLGSPGQFSAEPRKVFDELRAASAGGLADYSGLDWQQLNDGAARYWPVPASKPDGTPRLFLERFAHPDGRAQLVPVTAPAPARPSPDGHQLALVTGRLLEHYQSGEQTRRVAELASAAPEARLEIHPATALAHKIADGQLVEVSSSGGTVLARARTTSTLRLDTVFLPFHFPDAANVNLAIGTGTDPVSGMPEFKYTDVSIAPAEQGKEQP